MIGLLLDKMRVRKHHILGEEELDKIGSEMEISYTKSLSLSY
jgi:hypothetical protein